MLPVLIAGEMPLLNAILAIMAGTRVATLVLPPVCKGLPRHTTYAIISIRFFSIPTPEGCASLSVPTVSGEHTEGCILVTHAIAVDQDLTTLVRLAQEEITMNVPYAILVPSSIPRLEVSA